MSGEPTPIVFPETPGGAQVAASSNQELPADSGPRPLVFPDSPPALPARAPTAKPHDAGPGALVFPPSKPMPPAATVARPHISAVPSTADGPTALVFPTGPAKPAARAPGEVSFSTKMHPLQRDILARAVALSSEVAESNKPRLERMVASLLPVRQESLENYGAKTLAQCRNHAMVTARVSKRHVMLGAADLLERALASAAPALGLRQRLVQKFQQVTGDSPEGWVVQLTALRRELVELLAEVRAAKPEARADAERMAMLLLALRSTAEVCGTPPDRMLAFALDQRLETLRVALSQATLAPAQLEATETTAALQLVEVDRLINVTFSAVTLSNTMTGAPTGRA